MENDYLLNVQRPARYIGGEWNVHHKDTADADVKFALCFPDIYEIGMSNLGLRVLYDLLNRQDGVSCERCFCPWHDMRKAIREKLSESPYLCSLESALPLKEFDIVGFSISYELGFTNVLTMLSLAGIPLLSADRNEGGPLVIAGGQASLNPEPLADFIDAFIVGEGEEVILELVREYERQKGRTRSRDELLRCLSDIEGVYVPSIRKEGPFSVKKRVLSDLDSAPFPEQWLVPYLQIVHDRVCVEVMRGCGNRCRFCQGRAQYYPYRVKNVDTARSQVRAALRSSGYEEFSLLGLSVGDLPGLARFIQSLSEEFKDTGVNISLPSLKAKDFLKGIPLELSLARKATLTFAPEAGTERLRGIIGKDLKIEDLFSVAESAYKAGYRHIKLYFMIGLPTESEADLDGIADLAKEISELRRKARGGPADVHLSVATFIPKPHTPFQWLAMEGKDSIISKQRYLRGCIARRSSRIKLSFHNTDSAVIEAALCRGGRNLGAVIMKAWQYGACFDGWDEFLNVDAWNRAFNDNGLDLEGHASRPRMLNEALPWDHIDVGISKELLKSEFREALGSSE
ncbi:MAG: TIGR03960 family B12-binding radical SAM protein [Candidatus Omnitrophica bacterium]|nr:TIGR03960 family B12-binding radical SAM protein [Candidatus Omnitrophota bacterium]